MEVENHKSRYWSLGNWFMRKQKEDMPSYTLKEIEDGAEDKNDDYGGDLSLRSLEFDPCILINKLRIFVGTWNVGGKNPVGSLAVDLDEWLNLKNAADIYVLGFQEIVPLKTLTVIGGEDPAVGKSWNQLIGRALNDKFGCCSWMTPMVNSSISGDENDKCLENPSSEGSKYRLVASKKMVGVFISVWLREEVMRKYCVSKVRVCSVACGVMGYLGNKGSVAVSMSIEGTSFCFVAAHLASGEKKGDEGRRNHQVAEIFRRTYFSRTTKHHHYPHHPLSILGHDRIFWFGDLNYRLYSEDNFARNLIRKQDWKALQEFDQLQKELEEGGVFEGWKEGNIEFAPTYKYSSSISNIYYGGFPSRSWEKQRTPAWCDRILWYGKGVEQQHYLRSESKFSDHRPVSALFSTQIEVKSSSRGLKELQNITPKMLHPNHGLNKGEEDGKPSLLSLLRKDVKGC
ncbi:type IV inositol polyphosphate 5-phosphatase 6-like [Gastrolobium bilobum]|uniref:type IV inositol polyphosphate 5-phosphatase 6-like n=1 Tax=Gastrolobium bilobum TaxID=150636 RepID=UPI002AB2DE71|nr:type IV inositol polyphosphate 5-phosphatase 6-like [Gastrolobium bilobum]